MIRVHKEVKLNQIWEHEGCNQLHLDEELFLSVLGRYFIGTPLIEDEHFGSTITALDFEYSQKHARQIYLLHSDDIFRLRKVWATYFGDFDKEIGYFLWDTGDVAAFPEDMAENRAKHFTDYRMFVWIQ